eukprot:59477_1
MNYLLLCIPTWHATFYFIGAITISRIFGCIGESWALMILYFVTYILFTFILNIISTKQSVELTSFDTDITTVPMQVIDEVKEEKEIEYDDVTGIDDVSMDVDQTYQHPKPTPDQTRRHLDILNRNDSDFFKSKEYLDLIPTDSNWINRTPALKNATQKQHEDMLNSFVIPDAPFAYKRDVEEAIELFNTWRSWKNGKEWKRKTVIEDMTVYTRSVPGEAIDIIKGEGAVLPYPSAIILGVLINIHHRKQWDEKLDTLVKVKLYSEFSGLVYGTVNTPTYFIADRDMLIVAFVYAFEDGSVLMGAKSVQHNDYPPNQGDKVRALVTGDFWYITPDFENNVNHSRVTLYSHCNVGGELPSWLINMTAADVPRAILKVRKYMKSVHSTLHEKGSLHIPPFPCLKSLGIDIDWMDRVNTSPNEDHEDTEEEQKEVKSIKIINRNVILFDYPDLCVWNDPDELMSLLKHLSTDMDTALQAISVDVCCK